MNLVDRTKVKKKYEVRSKRTTKKAEEQEGMIRCQINAYGMHDMNAMSGNQGGPNQGSGLMNSGNPDNACKKTGNVVRSTSFSYPLNAALRTWSLAQL